MTQAPFDTVEPLRGDSLSRTLFGYRGRYFVLRPDDNPIARHVVWSVFRSDDRGREQDADAVIAVNGIDGYTRARDLLAAGLKEGSL